jgi:phenylalanyl-tRNA synthetase beta chain
VALLLPEDQQAVRFKPFSRFPAVIQDIALLVDSSVPEARVEGLIAGSALVAGVNMFDVYGEPSLPRGKRSLAFAVQFQAPDRTLTSQRSRTPAPASSAASSPSSERS